jgi:hypothetical protein
MKYIVHILAIHLDKQEKYFFKPLNSQYDIITRYYSDNNYQDIIHKFNLVVVIGKFTDNVDFTSILDLANKLGIKVFLPNNYNFDYHKLDEILLKFVDDNEHIKIKRQFFDNKKMILLGTEKYNKEFVKQEFLHKIESIYSLDDLHGGGGIESINITKKMDIFIIINSASILHNDIERQLKKMGFVKNIDFISLEDYCYATDREDEAFKQWKQNEQDNIVKLADKTQAWMDRTEKMSQWILSNINSIAEFGCGECHLKKILRPNVKYIGIDCIKRSEETIVCDVNNDTLPELNVDAVIAVGFFSYVKEPEKFLDYIASLNLKQFLVTYTPVEIRELQSTRYGNRSQLNYFSTGNLICEVQARTGLILKRTKGLTYDFQRK